jgi:hypothetical protein
VSATERGDAPIYAQLVQERGDVPADVRRTAEQTWHEVDHKMDFGLISAAEPHRR